MSAERQGITTTCISMSMQNLGIRDVCGFVVDFLCHGSGGGKEGCKSVIACACVSTASGSGIASHSSSRRARGVTGGVK